MVSLLDRIYDLCRRHLGRYTLEDPRPIAREAPYTFSLPSDADLSAMAAGDLVKLMFVGSPPGRQWAVERMWVKITEVTCDGLLGVLDNQPSDMPQLKRGDRVAFQPHNVIDIDWADPATAPASPSEGKQVWARCLVDRCVIEDGVAVSYVYREEPDMQEDGDKFPDSGWRVRGDWTGLSDEEIDARSLSYVAIGAVLNKDDSWLHLIDEPVGAAFIRDAETGQFVPEDRDES